jgi:putative ATP-dependent endonuclease of OLD family
MHPTVLVPEGRLDAAWLRQLVKVLELGSSNHLDPGLSFAHEVGAVPTADARAREVYDHLKNIHPSVSCLFDGDEQGNNYVAGVCRSEEPPRVVIRWPQGWTIESVIGWIVDADPAVLSAADLVAINLPQTSAELVAALGANLKTDEIVHGLIADAFISSLPCRRRIGHLMQFLSDVAMGRVPVAGHGASVNHANGTTIVWTFNHAILGI